MFFTVIFSFALVRPYNFLMHDVASRTQPEGTCNLAFSRAFSLPVVRATSVLIQTTHTLSLCLYLFLHNGPQGRPNRRLPQAWSGSSSN